MRTTVTAVAGAALLVAIGGCSGSGSSSSTSPSTSTSTTATIGTSSASPSPSGSGDEQAQAYANAEKAYRGWFDALNALRRRGGANVQAMAKYSSNGGAWGFAQQLSQRYQQQGWHSVGDATVRSVKPSSYVVDSGGGPRVGLISCEDTTAAKVVDRQGNPAVKLPPGAPHLFLDRVNVVRSSSGNWVVDSFKIQGVASC